MMFVSKAAEREHLDEEEEEENQRKRTISKHQSLTAHIKKYLLNSPITYCYIGVKVYAYSTSDLLLRGTVS
jgi:hypothetical protein